MTIICSKEVELLGEPYLIYLKEVPSQIEIGGEAKKTTVRAFIRKL